MGVQVKWRAYVAAAVSLLLAVPFMLAMGIALYPGPVLGPREDVKVLPVLSVEERQRLLTLERPCQRQEDCEPSLGCLQLRIGGPSLCMASECMTDLQCEEGYTCKAMRALDGGPWVRWCILEGRRKEGEPCVQGLGIRKKACERGLLCAAWCGRPCELDTPGSCPEGFYCKEGGPDGPSCLPTCEGRACPAGQQCIQLEGRTSVCAVVRGRDCQQQPCPRGQECRLHFPRLREQGLVMGMECVQPCTDGEAPCSEGLVCVGSTCRRPCEPDVPGACGPEETCTSGSAGGRPVCQLRLKD
jgi:hypothetical protein